LIYFTCSSLLPYIQNNDGDWALAGHDNPSALVDNQKDDQLGMTPTLPKQ
jgi:hypothetical protein